MKRSSVVVTVAAACAVVAAAAAGAAGAAGGAHGGRQALAQAMSDASPRTSSSSSVTAWARRRSPPRATTRASHNPLNVDRLPFTGFDTTWSVKPAAGAAVPARLRPRLGLHRHDVGDRPEDDRRADLAGPEQRDQRPRREPEDRARAAQQARGKRVGNVSTAEITDATPAVLASHISLRGCQGPADMAACPTETKAAGGLGSIAEQEVDHKVDVLLGGGRDRFEQTIASGPDAGRPSSQSAQAQGYQYVTDAAGLAASPSTSKPVLGLFNPGNMSLEWTGPAASTGKGNAPAPCTESQRPANEPSLADMTTQGDRPAGEHEGLLPPGRGRVDRQAGPRDQRVRPDRRDGRLRPRDRRRARLPGVAPGHAGRRHRRPLPHQPDRRPRTRAARPADRLLDQPDDQGRSDPDADLRHRRLRRPGRGAGRDRRRASSTPAPSSRSGARARVRSRSSARTTTPTCSPR